MLVPYLVYLWSPCIRHSAWHIAGVQYIHVECIQTDIVQELTCLEIPEIEAEDQVGWCVIHTAEAASYGWGIHVSPENHSLQSNKGDLKLKSLELVHEFSAYRIKTPFVMYLFIKLNK